MKKIILAVLFLTLACRANAQCVAEITDVKQDGLRGSIIVETEYKLNGDVVELGRTRYTEISGTNAEIIAKAKEDIGIHCENIIRRITANDIFRRGEIIKQQKALTRPIITSIKTSLVGQTKTLYEVTDEYKGKNIKVTNASVNTVSSVSVIE